MRTPVVGRKYNALVLLAVRRDDLKSSAIRELLEEHLLDMHAWSPKQSVHALDLEGLRQPDITFWCVWGGPLLLGCGALKALSAEHGEIKSMRTATAHRGRGVARTMLHHLIGEASRRGYTRLSLETGSFTAFEPARRLYAAFGFTSCGPFGDYREDPNSVFMTRSLATSPDPAGPR